MVIQPIKFVLTNLYRSRYSKSIMIQANLDRVLQGEKRETKGLRAGVGGEVVSPPRDRLSR